MTDSLGWRGGCALAEPACLLLESLGSTDLHFGGKTLFPGLLGGDVESMGKPCQVLKRPGVPHLCVGPRRSPLRDLLTIQLLPLLAQKPTLDMMSHSRLRGWPSVGLVGVQNTRPGPAAVQDGKKQEEKRSHRPVSVPGPEDAGSRMPPGSCGPQLGSPGEDGMASPEQQLPPHAQLPCENISRLLSQPREPQLSAKLASSPRPSTASLCPCEVSSGQGLWGRRACDGQRSARPAAPRRQVRAVVNTQAAHKGISAGWTEKTPASGLAAGGRATQGALAGPT